MTTLTVLDAPHLLGEWNAANARLFIDAQIEIYFIEFNPETSRRDHDLMVTLAAERGLEVMDEPEADAEVVDSGWIREYLAIREDVWREYDERMTA